MRVFFKKVGEIFKAIFGYGILLVLFAGGLTFFGYIMAIIIGGEIAAAMCTWIYKTFVPALTYVSTLLIVFGLITMYLAGEKALTPDQRANRSPDKEERGYHG